MVINLILPSVFDMDIKLLPVNKKVKLLVNALEGAEKINEALSNCEDGEAILDVLLNVSFHLRLGLFRSDLMKTLEILDWIWWKNKQALVILD